MYVCIQNPKALPRDSMMSRLTKQVLDCCVVWTCGVPQGDLQYFETCPGGEPGLRERLKNVLQNDFVRMTYTELVDLVRKDAKEGKVRCVDSPVIVVVGRGGGC